jgi:hypothetical protein
MGRSGPCRSSSSSARRCRDTAFPLTGAGRRLRAAGGRRALRASAPAHASRGGAAAEGGATGCCGCWRKEGPCRARARGRTAGLPSAVPAAATALDGGGRAAPSPKAAPVRLPGGLCPARQYAPACERQAGTGAAMPLRGGIPLIHSHRGSCGQDESRAQDITTATAAQCIGEQELEVLTPLLWGWGR